MFKRPVGNAATTGTSFDQLAHSYPVGVVLFSFDQPPVYLGVIQAPVCVGTLESPFLFIALRLIARL